LGQIFVETFSMFRTPLIAALTVALLGGTAMAQPANSPPADLSNSARNAPDYDDDDDLSAPPPGAYDNAQRNPAGRAQNTQDQAQAQADRDIFCRRDAAARTGYTTPREAARDEQTRGTIGGTLGGAALGAIIGAGAGNAGLGAAAGAGAGLIAGTAIGADNARHAARDVQADYADAYYGCMHQDNRQSAYYDAPPPPAYGYAPPPPAYYYPPPAYAYPYYPYSYGPSLSFGFGFGGGHGWGGGHRGFHGGGWRHR
jgi:outer membrane lipoprotein SlyB